MVHNRCTVCDTPNVYLYGLEYSYRLILDRVCDRCLAWVIDIFKDHRVYTKNNPHVVYIRDKPGPALGPPVYLP